MVIAEGLPSSPSGHREDEGRVLSLFSQAFINAAFEMFSFAYQPYHHGGIVETNWKGMYHVILLD